jgi:hypothetical protein
VRQRTWLLVVGGLLGVVLVLAAGAAVREDRTPPGAGNPPETTSTDAVGTPGESVATTELPPQGDVALERGATVAVLAYAPNVPPANPFLRPRPRNVFAAIEVEGCAGREGNAAGSLNPFFFALVLPDDTRANPTVPVVQPVFNPAGLAAGACRRGWVTFEIPEATKPTAIVFETFANPATWTIP